MVVGRGPSADAPESSGGRREHGACACAGVGPGENERRGSRVGSAAWIFNTLSIPCVRSREMDWLSLDESQLSDEHSAPLFAHSSVPRLPARRPSLTASKSQIAIQIGVDKRS